MATKLNFDKLDLQIISEMMRNASVSYKELGKTVRLRWYHSCSHEKLQRLGVITGSRYHINLKK